MHFDTELDQFLWGTDYGFRVQVGTPSKGETINVFRLGSDDYGSIILNSLPRDGVYTLSETGGKDCDKNHLYTLDSTRDYTAISISLKLLNSPSPRIPSIHSTVVDVNALNEQQYALLAGLLNHPEAMEGVIKIHSTVYLNNPVTRATVETFNSKFYADRGFEQSSDIVLFIADGEMSGKIFNLSRLYAEEVLDTDIIYAYLEKKAKESKFHQLLKQTVTPFKNVIVPDTRVSVNRSSQVNKREHLLDTLARHNEKITVHGEGSDFINYVIEERKIRLPYTLTRKEGLCIALMPVVENGYAYSPYRSEAIKMLVEKIKLDSQIKPYTMDTVHLIKNHKFSNPNEPVHEAEFTIMVNTGKRKRYGDNHHINKRQHR